MTADAVALEARKATDSDTDSAPTSAAGQAITAAATSAVASLTQRRLAHLPVDTRPLPSVAAYDQLLPSRRTPRKGTSP